MAIPWQPLSYEGVVVPIVSRVYEFSHRVAEHQYAFRDLHDVEMLGAGNPRLHYRIPLSEGIKLKEWGDSNLLTITLPRFMRACFRSEPGELIDPVHDFLRVVPVSYSEELTTAVREQVDVEVEFLLAPTEPDIPITGQNLASLGIMSGATEQLDLTVETIDLPPEVKPPGGFVNPLKLAQQYLSLGDAYVSYYTSQIDAYVGQLEELASAIERQSDPEAWLLKPTVDRLRMGAQRIAGHAQRAGAHVAKHTVQAATTLDALATLLGVGQKDLLQLNPHLADGPFLDRGIEVRLP